ncbi:hypothetical protein SLNWT_0353 [Streptomyces albus]|uniref:Maleylpyruvate isomerase family mycothiol-dependent enzyme n=2 Tax=Streptomyces albus subsp. albus TaxID=67257 RepID=A0A0B5EH51_STRA4|nr:hypothetical protein SLNWT_0353 [Streptomyces albus]AOU75040.1 hypothetical protein SLNHY_0349 [Streptomyces albus]AYN30847.1 maleylpyruvate isomerase family mycothiol-dependent enzyme [Streptomyces albus]CCD31818.1 hypothetical protein [Streptomyces albus subsp. albus]
MEISAYTGFLDREGRLLAEAAEEAGLDAKVPTCPGWQVRDLVRHTAMVHRWATGFVREGRTETRPMDGEGGLDGAELLAGFRAGHGALLDALESATPELDCWTFFAAPSPLAFWARRQAHETTMHRFDADSARGGTPAPVDGVLAVDGIDELLTGFHGRRRSRVRTPEPRTVHVLTTDEGASWSLRLSDGPPVAERGLTGEPDCVLSGPASKLYLALWNRVPFPEITGDARLAALWRETSAIV